MTAPQKLEKIGRYQVLERVGKGGMGVLYRGFDPVLDREVAIKLMHADFSEDTEQMRPRFYREARAAAKLQHRNIVTIFEFAEESNIPYIVMEFLRGTPLGARMKTQPPLTLDDKLNVVAQLCDGLSYAHEQGVVHRDVKPDNIFLLEDGSVKLLDFGIAKLTTSTLTRQGDVLGSASYMSPEQVGGSESVDGRADVFSTGVVLYELLTGRKPFEGDSPTAVIVKILKDDPTAIETLAPGLPPDLVTAVTKALAKDPATRFQSADAFGRQLQAIRKTLHPSASRAQLDETRYASTQVLKALHEDLKRARAGAGTSGEEGAVTRAVLPTGSSSTAGSAPAQSRSWLIPAVGVGVLVVAVAGFALLPRGGSATPPATVAAAPATNATPGPAPTSPANAPAAVAAAVTPSATPVASTATASPPAAEAIPAGAAPKGNASPRVDAKKATAVPTAAAAATTPAPGALATPPAPPAAAMVAVSLTGAYPFEVLDGARSISALATSHELKQPAGKALQIRAPKFFLSQTVRVEGTASQPFEYIAPGLGRLDVRSPQETCEVVIAGAKLGNPPLVQEIAAGSYKVDLMCGEDVVGSHYATVRAGQTYRATIR
jgi:serine/threonine-protein kinase